MAVAAQGTLILRTKIIFPLISGITQSKTFIKSDPGDRAV